MLVGMATSERSPSRSVSSNQSQPAKVVVPAEPLREISAQQLAQAYDRNTVAADQQCKGKRCKVTGVVDSSNTDLC
ncbi:OB-fold protein, partial [Pseudomonas aeruginosa]|uniref:OB-fold protein n=1 Tax=Pseudomonas aeruginosa TaxID=287 RepID=UPI003891B78E